MRNEFIHHVRLLSQQLPNTRYAVNLCNDRYLFMVAFSAAIISGQTNLLPANRAARTILDVVQAYEESYCLSDEKLEHLELPENQIFIFDCQEMPTKDTSCDIPVIPEQHIAAIAFTSGSTGQPSPNPKTWASLIFGAQKAQQRFEVGKHTTTSIVATVPPQHMYGLETTVMLPLTTDCCVYAGITFYPEDIRLALNNLPEPRVLVTTPVHLRACTNSNIDWPNVERIISATAPLSTELAKKSENVFSTVVYEIYGFTEAGSIASRRTIKGNDWMPYDGFAISQKADTSFVDSESFNEPVPLTDIIELKPNGNFELLGRESDLINIAGKRASLADLNQKLLSINGIQDGVFFVPEEKTSSTARLVAFVVVSDTSENEIRQKLSTMIDRAFLPRPLLLVKKLPRTESSKLPRKRLIEMYNTLRKETAFT
ncbi:MAG: acyl-CoA synthetase [Proteobacteria bacterium]|nr:acyl-CoA synthetase [Pseudomonadota bacterium]